RAFPCARRKFDASWARSAGRDRPPAAGASPRRRPSRVGGCVSITGPRRGKNMADTTRRDFITTSAAIAAAAATTRALGQSAARPAAPGTFYERGDVRIRYFDTGGTGFPLLVIPGGGLNSTITALASHPFDPIEEFRNE